MTASPSPFDPNTPSPARIWNYWVGGTDNFAADRAQGDAVIKAFPPMPEVAAAARDFGRRATRYFVEQGVTQIVDLGGGIPDPRPLYEVALAAAPDAAVAYVDNDPVAVAGAERILDREPAAAVAAIAGDLRDPAAICRDPGLRQLIDFSQPVAFLLVAVLHFIPGDEAAAIAARFMAEAPSGSYLAICHHTGEGGGEDEASARKGYSGGVQELIPRTREQITAFFKDLDIVSPGIVPTPSWRPDPGQEPGGEIPLYYGYAGVGRKP